jgi:hypothetical protein
VGEHREVQCVLGREFGSKSRKYSIPVYTHVFLIFHQY